MALSSDGARGGASGLDLGTVDELATVRWKAQPNVLWVQVRTSEGIVGLGETYYLPGAVESVLHDLAADLLIGQPAGAITRTWTTVFSCTNFFGFAGAEMRALSALDMALWDALGQAAGLPVTSCSAARYATAFRPTTPASTPGRTTTGTSPSTTRPPWPRIFAIWATWG